MKSILFRMGAILLVVLCLSPLSVSGQVIEGDLVIGDTAQIHRVVTKRGDVFLGRVTQIENTTVKFLFNKTIELTFQLTDLEEIRVVDAVSVGKSYSYDSVKGEFLKKEQPVYGLEHGFLLPTGYLLPKGESEVRNLSIFYTSYDYGLSDNLNVGLSAIPLIAVNVLQLRLRAGVSIGDQLHLSLNGNAYIVLLLFEELNSAVSASGALTYGNSDRNLTAGAGYGFALDDSIDQGVFMATIGGSYRVSKNWRLVGELITSVNQPGLFVFTGGANWLLGQHRLELGLGAGLIDFSAFPYPFLGYGYRF